MCVWSCLFISFVLLKSSLCHSPFFFFSFCMVKASFHHFSSQFSRVANGSASLSFVKSHHRKSFLKIYLFGKPKRVWNKKLFLTYSLDSIFRRDSIESRYIFGSYLTLFFHYSTCRSCFSALMRFTYKCRDNLFHYGYRLVQINWTYFLYALSEFVAIYILVIFHGVFLSLSFWIGFNH